MVVKEENDLLTLFGQWMYIKSKINMFKSISQCYTIQMVDLNDLSFLKRYSKFRILNYLVPYSLQLILL